MNKDTMTPQEFSNAARGALKAALGPGVSTTTSDVGGALVKSYTQKKTPQDAAADYLLEMCDSLDDEATDEEFRFWGLALLRHIFAHSEVRVHHFPQVPCKPFVVNSTITKGQPEDKMNELISKEMMLLYYDAHQLSENIKPEFFSATCWVYLETDPQLVKECEAEGREPWSDLDSHPWWHEICEIAMNKRRLVEIELQHKINPSAAQAEAVRE